LFEFRSARCHHAAPRHDGGMITGISSLVNARNAHDHAAATRDGMAGCLPSAVLVCATRVARDRYVRLPRADTEAPEQK
jgi:hypothetical protein